MPSPFPGMDPYLEDPGLWPDLHHRLITLCSDVLVGQVRPRYFVRIEERVYVSDAKDPGRKVIAPDLMITMRPEWRDRPFEPSPAFAGEIPEPVSVAMMLVDEIHEPRVEIVDRESREVVTVIEILSPSNKVSGSRGQASYEQKREQVLNSPTHFIEIDLLREGEPISSVEPLPPHEYLIHVSRVSNRPRGMVWPVRLAQRLPVIPVPLREGDADVSLDLQALLMSAYERAGYDLSVDYSGQPEPPLPPEWSAWADRLLKEKGLRPPGEAQ